MTVISKRGRLLAALAMASCVVQPLAAQAPDQPAADAPSYIIEYDSIHHPVIGRHGMVASQEERASRIGAEILRQGGNAVDAAVATGLALAVTLPRAGNLGGGGFMLIYLAAEKKTIALDYYDEAPMALRPDTLLGADGKIDQAKRYSYRGVGVPGTALGLFEAHRKYGRLKWRKLVEPAIQLAERGYVVSDDLSNILTVREGLLRRDPAAARAFYTRAGTAPTAGSKLVQPDLAWSLRELRDHGADAFYRGAIADRLVAAMRANGGLITKADLASYQIRETEPIWGSYRGKRIAYMPSPSGGVFLAELMNILERFRLKEMGQNSSSSLHVIAEASKLVFGDRAHYAGGYPGYSPPTDGLISKDYAAARARLIRMDRSLSPAEAGAGNPFGYESRDTTHFSVVDAEGNAVSNTFTLGSDFGAQVMAPGTGFLLNDALANFAWTGRGASANAPAPRKRVVSTISPIIVCDNDTPWLVSGSPGGTRIFSAVAQLLVNVIDHGLNVAEATERPRVFQGMADTALELEPGFPPDMIGLLKSKGHQVRPASTMGSTQSIIIEGNRLLGASDTRRPDAAAVAAESGLRTRQSY